MTDLNIENNILNYQKELLAFAFFLTKNKDKAEDLRQDTYTRVFSKELNFAHIKNIKSYLNTIMYNIYIDGIRKEKRKMRYYDNLLRTQEKISHNNAESDFNCEDIHKNIQSIKADWRELLLMYSNGFEYAEIAKKTGLNIGTLRMRIYYAKRELKNYLEKI
jgi:RNA polymerase sigma-70 factor, ECF subfamily